MTPRGASSSAFTFTLDTASGVPAYRQVIDQILGAIAAGHLRGGDQLPTVRQAAVDLAINPNTVVRAYRELEIRGVLTTQQGLGTFITREPVRQDEAVRQRQLDQLVGETLARAGAVGVSADELLERLREFVHENQEELNMAALHLFRPAVAENDSSPVTSPFAAGLFLLHVLVTTGWWRLAGLHWYVVLPALLGLYFAFSLKVAAQWQKAAVLRLGKYRGLRGPGLFHVIPLVDSVSQFVDQRVRVTDVRAETALTRDTVPVSVDAIVFWVVWNPEKAILEVSNFTEAVTLSAQTALRESIGRHELSQMITDREALGHELQKILDEKTNPWGVTVQSVEIRDVQLPKELEDAMSRRAQAERERQARVILGTAETEISEKFAQAALAYENNPVALHLRAMNMLYEALKEKGSMVIVPSSAVETMGLGGLLGTASLAGQSAVAPGVTKTPGT